MSIESDLSVWFSEKGLRIRRRIRVLMLLDATDYAVISPIPIFRFHALAFLADVLSPLYEFPTVSGTILKRRSSPYYPDLQRDIDRLIGLDLVTPLDLKSIIHTSRAYVDFSLTLNRKRVAPLLRVAYAEEQLCALRDYFRALASALSDIDDADLDSATKLDVTWDSGHMGTVIDYAEWNAINRSILGANKIEQLATKALGDRAIKLSPAAKVSLYVCYLRRAVNS